MAKPGRLVASLNVVGKGVDPDEISRKVGASPDKAHRVGDQVSTRTPATWRSGVWSISTAGRLDDRATLSDHIRDLLSRVTRDDEVWADLAERHSTRILVGWFMDRENEGDGVDPDVPADLGRLQLWLDFDVYSATPADDRESSGAAASR